jgi:acid phosphatase type 7
MPLLLLLLFSPCVLSSGYSPEQVHLSWSSSDSTMTVTWASDWPSDVASVVYTPVSSPLEPVLRFSFKAQGAWVSFPNLSNPRLLLRHLHVCAANMTGLVLGHWYKYRVGSDLYGWSKEFAFEAKRNFTENTLARFLVYGDLGIGPQIDVSLARLIEETKTYKYDAVIHNGDFAYDLNLFQGTYGDYFLNAIEPIASQIPYMVSQGNHENSNRAQHYYYRFNMPSPSNNLWYSFNAGKAHFLAYTTEPMFENHKTLLEEQMAFIQQDLASVDREQYPWLIVFGHRPLYCSANMTAELLEVTYTPPYERHNQDCLVNATTVRNTFEEVFYQNQVDFVITSHVHAYERLASVYQNESVPCEQETENLCVNAKAPVYVVTGVPGQQESYAPVSPTPLPFSVFQDDKWGFSRLTIFNATHLLWEQVHSESGEVVDYLWLEKR